MDEKKTSKLRDIKETASDAVEIMRQIGTPGVLDSLNKIQETATKVSEIMKGLQTPEMVRNIENFRLISENMNEASTKMQDTINQLKETTVFDEATEVIKSVKGKINSFGNGNADGLYGKDIHAMSVTTRDMLISIKELMNELSITVATTKKSGIISNVRESINEVSDIYKNTLSHASR